MSSQRMNRPALISVFSDQRRTKSTISSRVSCGTQTLVRVPQLFFLGPHAPPSVRPALHPSSGPSFPDTQSAPVRADGSSVLAAGKRRLLARRTPSASGRTRLAGVPTRHTGPRSALLPPNVSSEWRPSLPACSVSVVSSCVRSVILTDERLLHFQLRQDTSRTLTLTYDLYWSASFLYFPCPRRSHQIVCGISSSLRLGSNASYFGRNAWPPFRTTIWVNAKKKSRQRTGFVVRSALVSGTKSLAPLPEPNARN